MQAHACRGLVLSRMCQLQAGKQQFVQRKTFLFVPLADPLASTECFRPAPE